MNVLMPRGPRDVIQHDRRLLMVPYAVLGVLAGIAPFVDPGAFSGPIFDPIRAVAPLGVWGVAWLVAGVAALWAATSRSWRGYAIAVVLTLFLSAVWCIAILWAKFVDDIALTYTALGLWGFVVAASMVLARRPTHVDRRR